MTRGTDTIQACQRLLIVMLGSLRHIFEEGVEYKGSAVSWRYLAMFAHCIAFSCQRQPLKAHPSAAMQLYSLQVSRNRIGPKSTQTRVVGIITDDLIFKQLGFHGKKACRDASHLLLLYYSFVYFLALYHPYLLYLVVFYTCTLYSRAADSTITVQLPHC